MKLVMFPAVDERRLALIHAAVPRANVVNAATEAAAIDEIADADAFFGKITPALLAAAQRLQWVQSPTASLEHYLFPALIEHPCRLSNMRGLFSDVIADHVMGFVISLARHLHVYRDQQRAEIWEPIGGESERRGFATGPGEASEIDRRHLHLADCTLGVIGVGAIGSEVCRRAAAFQMHVIGIDPVTKEVPGVIPDVWRMDRFDELLRESDFVVIAAPHTPVTERLFRRPQFETMKRSAYLINIGRGIIVDLADLTAALTEGLIAGAALDVLETEPLPAGHPLWSMPNVILTPHVAAASVRVPERHTATLLENLRRFDCGETPLNLVDKTLWY